MAGAPGDAPGKSEAFHCGTGLLAALSSELARASAARGEGNLCSGAPGTWSSADLSTDRRILVEADGLFSSDGESPSAFASVALPFMVHRHQRMRCGCAAMGDRF